MIENEVTGRKYRILTNKEEDEWDRISFWTSASDVYYSGDTGSAEENRPINIIQRNYTYKKDDIVYVPSAKSWAMFVCTKAGQTSNILPSAYKDAVVGASISDGSAYFVLYDIRPSSTASDSDYQVPAMSLVNNINDQLTAPDGLGTKFYFDYQNGKYGYNTSSSRSPDTFHAFGGAIKIKYNYNTKTSGSTITLNSEEFPGCENWITENFIVIPCETPTKKRISDKKTISASGDIEIGGGADFVFKKEYNQTTKTLSVRCQAQPFVTGNGDDAGGITQGILCDIICIPGFEMPT